MHIRRSLINTVNYGGRLLGNSRLKMTGFDLHDLLDEAQQKTGYDDFGSREFMQPLAVLLDSYTHEAALSFIGRIAMRQDILHTLKTHLQIEADYQNNPGLFDTSVRSPVFIIGLPRSGTTLLHNLLAMHRGLRAPEGWEVMFPSPPPGAVPDRTDPRVSRAQKRMQQLYWLAPEFKVIHPLDARLPQECIAITSYAFMSDAFLTLCHVPGYQRWLDTADAEPAYRYHHRFLQYLQGGDNQIQWILKAPAHLFFLDTILRIYPDARFIYMHRNPIEVLPSVANLTRVLRSAFSDRTDAQAIGQEVLVYWSRATDKAREVLDQLPDRQARCLHIYYQDVSCQPLVTLRKIYQYLGHEMTHATERHVQAYLHRHPKNEFGRHRYSLAQFGLDAGEIDTQFSRYKVEFFPED